MLGLAFLFGAFVRWLPAYLANFPINDGGMFAVMMRDLSANHFALPVFTSYNNAQIPFAYPPLGFYAGALLESLGVSERSVLLWLPAFFAALTLPAFYLLSLEILENRPRAAAATIFFALTPGNYVWHVMGGGLTRALGAIFFALALYFVRRAFRETNWRAAVFAAVFCALAVLSHPQIALLTALECAVFLLFYGRSRRFTLRALAIAAGTLILTAPWWATVAARHGFSVFLSAGLSGDLQTSLTALAKSLLARKTVLPFSTLFWLLGLGWTFYKRRFDVALLVGLPYLIDQRSAPIAASFVYPMLAAYGALDVLPKLFFRSAKKQGVEADSLLNSRAFALVLLGIIFYLLIECAFHAQVIQKLSLPPAARQMMAWVNRNTPADGKFLILTGRANVMTDSTQEWFPAFAARHSTTTLQGLEWTLGAKFTLRWLQLDALQRCRAIECVDTLTRAMNLDFNYVVVNRAAFPTSLFSSSRYETLFDNGVYAVLH
ncbi:MAG: hypothetical protein Fur002_07040 [Anaerolineales bacterium]